jgi:hypothetical protein
MEGALEGGATGTIEDAGINNVLPEDQLLNGVNVPTGGPPSPLFGAEPFTQTMLRTEEFGTEPLDPTMPAPALPVPRPSVGPLPDQAPTSIFKSGPDPAALDAFLDQPGIAPFPSQFANTLY